MKFVVEAVVMPMIAIQMSQVSCSAGTGWDSCQSLVTILVEEDRMVLAVAVRTCQASYPAGTLLGPRRSLAVALSRPKDP